MLGGRTRSGVEVACPPMSSRCQEAGWPRFSAARKRSEAESPPLAPRKKARAATLMAALGLAGSFATLATGCPEGVCLLKICNNGHCSCSIATCADGAGFDVNQNRCRCLKGYFDV